MRHAKVAGHTEGTSPESRAVVMSPCSPGRCIVPRRCRPVDEVPVKAPGDRSTVLTDGALQRTGCSYASGVCSIGCPVFLSTGTDRRWFEVPTSMPQPTGQQASTALERITLRRGPGRHIRASQGDELPPLAPERMAGIGGTPHEVGTAGGRHQARRAHDAQEPIDAQGDPPSR